MTVGMIVFPWLLLLLGLGAPCLRRRIACSELALKALGRWQQEQAVLGCIKGVRQGKVMSLQDRTLSKVMSLQDRTLSKVMSLQDRTLSMARR